MGSEPSLSTVLAAVSALYTPITLDTNVYNENQQTRESASKFLSDLQSSQVAWKISDELLQHSLYVQPDVEACYYAAQTLRTKIQNNFNELPPGSHESLRESITRHLVYLSGLSDQRQLRVIRTQLTISLAHLVILDENWSDPLSDLVNRLPDKNTLLQVLTYVPEELSECGGSRQTLKGVSSTRRKQVTIYLASVSRTIISLLSQLDKEMIEDKKQHAGVYRSFSSWIHLLFYSAEDIVSDWQLCQPLLQSILTVLTNPLNADEDEHDSAGECLCVFINSFFSVAKLLDTINDLSKGTIADSNLFSICGSLIEMVLATENAYISAEEEVDKSINFVRLFTEAAESSLYLLLTLVSRDPQEPSLLKTKETLLNLLRLMLTCTSGHFDFDVVEVSFGFYHKFADEIYHLLIMSSSENLPFDARTRIRMLSDQVSQQLISALRKHSAIDEDNRKILPIDSDFREFRSRVRDLLRDFIFMYGPVKLISNVLLPGISQNPTVTNWDKIEVDLFFLSVLVRDLSTSEEKNDALLVQIVNASVALASLPTHPQVKATACDLLRELHHWLPQYPDLLNSVFSFLLSMIVNQASPTEVDADLANEASSALEPIINSCFGTPDGDTGPSIAATSNPESLIPILCSICCNLDAVRNEDSAHNLLQSAANLISAMTVDASGSPLRDRQEALVLQLLVPHLRPSTDPIIDLDRMSSLLRSLRLSHPPLSTCLSSPLGAFISGQLWPMIQKLLETHASNSSSMRLIERACRTLRFILRSLRPDFLIEPAANCIWNVYQEHPQHSALLYVASIIIDEFANDGDGQLSDHLMSMLKAFSLATFTYLTKPPVSLREHPDTIDDFFRLCTRYLQKQPLKFLKEAIDAASPIQSSIELAMAALDVDQREAVISISKFLSRFLDSALEISHASGDDGIRALLATHLAPRLMDKILFACCVQLPSYFIPHLTEVVWSLITLDVALSKVWIKTFIDKLLASKGNIAPDCQQQLTEAFESLIQGKSAKNVAHALRAISKVYK